MCPQSSPAALAIRMTRVQPWRDASSAPRTGRRLGSSRVLLARADPTLESSHPALSRVI